MYFLKRILSRPEKKHLIPLKQISRFEIVIWKLASLLGMGINNENYNESNFILKYHRGSPSGQDFIITQTTNSINTCTCKAFYDSNKL